MPLPQNKNSGRAAMLDYPSVFDYQLYLSASKSLGFFWFAWKAPGEKHLRVERQFPEEGYSEKLQSLHEWANRTDPDLSVRYSHILKVWAERKPGQDVVSPFWLK